MNDASSKIGDQIDSGIRMLNTARAEFRSDHGEDAAEFLRAAQRRIGAALNGLETTAKVVTLRESNHAR